MREFGAVIGGIGGFAAFGFALRYIFPLVMAAGISYIETNAPDGPLNALAGAVLIFASLGLTAGIGVLAFYVCAAPVLALDNFVVQQREAAEGRRRNKALEHANAVRHAETQLEYGKRLASVIDEALTLFDSIPTHLQTAEAHLSRAESDFSERAFAPFWDSIEDALKAIGRSDEVVQRIGSLAVTFKATAAKYERTPPIFPITSDRLVDINVTTSAAARLQAIVRKAQRDFQFASIYEQRKTNRILVAGFANLADALRDISGQLEHSIASLHQTVLDLGTTVGESLEDLGAQFGQFALDHNEHASQAKEAALDAGEREQQALEMLDNIQRRRRPYP